VNTDKDVYGLGEATSQVWYYGETLGQLTSLLTLFEKQLIGEDPIDIARLHRIMELSAGGGAPGTRSAFAAIDMAAYDIIGKVQERPVYDVLGGAYRTNLELLTNLYQKTPDEMAEACKRYVDLGFRGLKVKVGDVLLREGWSVQNLQMETDKLVAALESVSSDIYVDADANQGWKSPKVAINAVKKKLSLYPNLALEQPLKYFDLSGHRLLRQALDIPIILDESVISPEMLVAIVKAEAADRIVLKLNRLGGFWPARQAVAIAEAAALGISVDTSPFGLLGDTASCHLAATIRDPYPVDAEGHTWFVEKPYVGGIQIKGGMATLPDAPGLGVELVEEFAGRLGQE